MAPRACAILFTAIHSACGYTEAPSEAAPPAATDSPAAALAAQTGASSKPDRKYVLERVDDVVIAQLYADGFKDLPLRQKLLIWHLSQAAIAGRDIYYDQKNAHALEMRRVLEAVLAHAQDVDASVLAELTRYAKLFWINNGPHDLNTARKFVLGLSHDQLAAAVRRAAQQGAMFPTRTGESLDQLLDRLGPMFFDPKVEPQVTNKTPGPGKDILTASANNLYAGVRIADLDGFKERYGRNSRLVAEEASGRILTEEVYRIDGLYAAEIRAIVSHLKNAIPYASGPTAAALRALIRFYTTGEEADLEAAEIAWVRDDKATVDFINGFVEVYLDPRGVKGSWEALVYFVNREKTARISRLAGDAAWFEARMPYAERFRKLDVRGISATVADVIVQTGDIGPALTAVGINLPNSQSIRERYGSKSMNLGNVLESYQQAQPKEMLTEFALDRAEAERALKYAVFADDLLTDLHEVVGHASGRQSPDFKGTPQEAIKEHYSAIEEARADLIGLHYIADHKLVELGIIEPGLQADIALAAYEAYARNVISQLRRVPEGSTLEEDHARNMQMVVHWLMANTGAVHKVERDGKTYYKVRSSAEFRAGVARLLAEVQRIKSEGDYLAAKKLFDTYGIHFDPALRDEVVRRSAVIRAPLATAFVMPKLTPVIGGNGEIVDVEISYPMDFAAQMLEYSASAPALGGQDDSSRKAERVAVPSDVPQTQLPALAPSVPQPGPPTPQDVGAVRGD